MNCGDFGESFVERERQFRFRKAVEFDDSEIYYFGVVQLPLQVAQRILSTNPPPAEYKSLNPIERTAYLYYFTLYQRYLTPVTTFHRVFNREFYKYTCDGDSDVMALWKICKHTLEEYKNQLVKQNQTAYDLSQKRLFSDERDSSGSRNSERPSFCDYESDVNSIDSNSKEPLLFTRPHMSVSFGVGGRIIITDPKISVSTVCIEDVKQFCTDQTNQRHIVALESFKGPLLIGETRPQTPLLFIQRQIERIVKSDVYCANPSSGDANDCLLIWHLLEVLVRQQGKVTGPDLACLLVENYSYTSNSSQNLVRGSTEKLYDKSLTTFELHNEHVVDVSAMDKCTQYLLGGHIEEAIESAAQDGLLFDALFLAHRLFKNDTKKLNEIEEQLLRYRKPQHPIMTLLSVAGEVAVPLLTNTTKDDASGWRAHIAIILANLQTSAAIDTVYQMGLALAQKEFNSAADFCFLAVNLLTGFDCFLNQDQSNKHHRKYIKLINASLPDDEFHSTITRFGWSILDFQATEIFEYALKLSNNTSSGTPSQTPLSRSFEFQKCRLEYAKLLSEFGGFIPNVFNYCSEIARSIWDYAGNVDVFFLKELCDLADRYHYVANTDTNQKMWITALKALIPQNNALKTQIESEQSDSNTEKLKEMINMQNLSLKQEILKPIAQSKSPILEYKNFNDNAILPHKNLTKNQIFAEPDKIKQPVEQEVPLNLPSTINNNHSCNNYYPDDSINKQHQNKDDSNFSSNTNDNDLTSNNLENSTDSINEAPINFNSFYGSNFSYNNNEMLFQLPLPPQINPEELNVISTPNNHFENVSSNDIPVINEKNLTTNNNSNSNNVNEISNNTSVSSGGLLSGLKNRLVKIIPASNSMNLPDDRNPEIRWNEELQRYVGEGIKEDTPPPPPPTINNVSNGIQSMSLKNNNVLNQTQQENLIDSLSEMSVSDFRLTSIKKNVAGQRGLQKRYHNAGFFSAK